MKKTLVLITLVAVSFAFAACATSSKSPAHKGKAGKPTACGDSCCAS